MKIEIVTPYQQIVNDEADEVYAMGPKGEFGILPGHAHYVTPLMTGRLFYQKNGKKHAYVVDGGFMEVYHEKVQVLADEVEKADHIDLSKAKQELEQLERQLGQESLEPEEFQNKLKHRDREIARIQVASEEH
jgi:F-type H+-transporting ATPase subunit epsilon